MADKILQLVENLSNLRSEESVLTSVHELNVIVDSRAIDGEQLVALIPPNILFNRLALNRSEELKVCIVLLKKLLNFVKPEVIIAEYEVPAVEGLNHPSEDVRELCLSQVERCVETVSGVIGVVQSSDLLNFVIRSLSDSNMGCVTKACRILTNVGKTQEGLALLLDTAHLAEFDELINKNGIISFRVYELFVKILESDHNAFMQVRPMLNKMANEINSDDVLIQMNCIELLTDIVQFGESGFQFPEETGVSKKLYGILVAPESSPMSTLLLPGIIKFFGFLSTKKPRLVFEKYPVFFQFVFHCIIINDGSLIEIALDTIGTIGLANEGLSVLFQSESQRNIMAKIGNCLQSSEDKLRVHSLDCLTSLFSCDKTSDKNTLDLIHVLYLKLAVNPLELLFKAVKQPFIKVRRSCFKVFHSLASYQWMLEDMKNIPGFLEYVIDRRTESEKECQELKYEVVKKMTSSANISLVFEKPVVLKLKQFVRDGPFYVGSDVSVAMEGTQ